MENYLRPAFEELFDDDGLMVMGKGLGVQKLFGKFVKLYCSAHATPKLVLCLNSNDIFDALKKILLADGVLPLELPKV